MHSATPGCGQQHSAVLFKQNTMQNEQMQIPTSNICSDAANPAYISSQATSLPIQQHFIF
jgi:hypothetical protein